jgi:hypothetical protein
MLDLIALPPIPETSANWMQSRRGKGASILPRASTRWEKTLPTAPVAQNQKDRDRWGSTENVMLRKEKKLLIVDFLIAD